MAKNRSRKKISASAVAAPSPPPSQMIVGGICLGLFVLTWAVFGRALGFEFTNFDDQDYVYDNPEVTKGLTFRGIAWAFSNTYANNWHPLTFISHMLDCQLFGLNPGGHHFTNILIHSSSVVLLFIILRRMTGTLYRSAFVAALFAIHPLHVESVAWVAERKDVLSGFFFVLTLGAYLYYTRKSSIAWYLLVTVLFAMGLMAKPMLVTLPAVLLLLDYWPLRRMAQSGIEWKRLVVEKLPWVGLSILSCVATTIAQRSAISSIEQLRLETRLANAAVSYVVYLRQLFWPGSLAVFYPYPGKELMLGKMLLALALLIGITVGIFRLRKTRPYLTVGWLWFLGTLVPVIGIMQVGSQAHADRYTYLPYIGLSIAGSWWIADLALPWPKLRYWLGTGAAVVLAALSLVAWRQVGYWHDSEVLWRHALAVTENNEIAHNNLGNILFKKNRNGEDVAEFEKAARLRPNDSLVESNLGNALLKQGQPERAIPHLEKALRTRKDEDEGARAHYDLGDAFRHKGEADEAIAHYREAISAKPEYADVHYNLGNALLAKGELDEAIISFRRALQFHFAHPAEAYNNLASALLRKGLVDEAIANFRKAIEVAPASDKAKKAEALYNLANALLRKNQLDEAIVEYRNAIELQPSYWQAHNNLGNALERRGLTEPAIVEYRRATELKPNDPEPDYNLGNLYRRQRRFAEAIPAYSRAIELRPDYSAAQNNLAGALLEEGRVEEAIVHFRKVLELRAHETAEVRAKASFNLATALLRKGDSEGAIGFLRKTIELSPNYADAFYNLGNALAQRGQQGAAVAQYQKALELNPNSATTANQLAWLLVTSPDKEARDAEEALRLARKADETSHSENPEILRTLAAAYAANAEYPAARSAAESALRLAEKAGDARLVENLRKEIGCYALGQACY